MESSARGRSRITVALVLLLLPTTLLGGCGTSPLAPAQDPGPPQYTADNPPPFLHSSQAPLPLGPRIGGDPAMVLVTSKWVDPGLDKTVAGGRYAVRFLPGSLSQGAQVVIRERGSERIEFDLGPHGSAFGEPVELTIDFAGTNADSTAGNYDGSVPMLYWFNEDSGLWEVVPGKVDGMKFHTTLGHFSSYGLARGKSGW